MKASPTARRRARARLAEPGRAAWKEPHSGRCEGCGRRGQLVRHHVVTEQVVRRVGGDPWDQANAMNLGRWCRCHADHHAPNGKGRLPLSKVPVAAVEFARALLGDERAAAYLSRFYAA